MKPVRGLCVPSIVLLLLVAISLEVRATECVGDFTDDFGDGDFAPVWIGSGSSCSSAQETGGRVVLIKGYGCGTGPRAYMDMANYVVCGDFDVRVDFELIDFATDPGTSWSDIAARLIIFNSSGWKACVERYNRTERQCYMPSASTYKAWTTVSNNCSPEVGWAGTSDQTGTFRITRTGSTVNLFYWDKIIGSWGLLKSDTITADDVGVLIYMGPAAGGCNHRLEVQYDNMSIESYDPAGVAETNAMPATTVSPNPFRIRTSVCYDLPEPGKVRIGVYDINGRLIRLLVDSPLEESGHHTVEWDGQNQRGARVTAGTYFFCIRTDGAIETRPLVIVR
ncbi:MAG: FlgD immunoglobulin-like domain containing protein [Candidatus Eisenbacteria bacterium]